MAIRICRLLLAGENRRRVLSISSEVRKKKRSLKVSYGRLFDMLTVLQTELGQLDRKERLRILVGW